MRLSSLGEAFVEGDQLSVPAERGRQSGRVNAFAQSVSAAGDMTFALAIAAVMNERRQAGERGGLLARQATEFRHPDDEGERGTRSDPMDGTEEVEPPGEIFMGAQGRDQPGDYFSAAALEPLDVGQHDAAQLRIAGMLEPNLDAHDILFGLLDEGELIGKRSNSGVWRLPFDLMMSHAGGDQAGIDTIALGAAQDKFCKGAHLPGLQHDDVESGLAQIFNHVALVAAGGFQTDPGNLAGAQQAGKVVKTGRVVRDLPAQLAAVDGNVQFGLGHVDSGHDCVSLAHLPRPFLVMRTPGSFNHPGPMKSRSRSCSPTAQKALERTIRRPATRSGWPSGAGRSSWNEHKIADRFNTRSAATPRVSNHAAMDGRLGSSGMTLGELRRRHSIDRRGLAGGFAVPGLGGKCADARSRV